MSDALSEFDPFHRPSAYDILEIKNGLQASAKDIGRAYNKLKNDARKKIKDVKERAARLEALDRAKEQLQRPESRVLTDFFLLGDELFGDLCRTMGQRLAASELPTQKALGKLFADRPYDDLLPQPLEQVHTEFQWVDDMEWFDEPGTEEAILEITRIEE